MAITESCIKRRSQAAFTLIELLITLVIFSVAITAIYTSYLTQQKTYVAQTEVTAMQQNIRAGMYHLERELHMAGFDPHNTAKAGFLIASTDELQITADLNEDGNMIAGTNDENEQVRYAVNDGYLRREIWGGGLQPLAQNIEVLDLVYLDEDNDVLNPSLGDVSNMDLKKIRSVQVTMVARTEKPDPKYRNTNVYRNQQDEVILTAQNDHYRRRTLTTTIRCRNMGL
ncbi:MAG: PilW family protein [Desulfobacteraceae bacterium]|jgi:type IV pilus assembly protein PilW|nr:PilW family protein [Desulfobacteraceae bacterium]